jgi:lipopolysaccharide transport system permease protein
MSSYAKAVWSLRYFWLSLVKMDLRSRYRRSFLGIAWSLLQPIAMTIVLSIVFSQLFDVNITEFGPFLMSGLTFWAFICYAVSSGCQCFYQAEGYIRSYPAPVAIYPLRVTLAGGVHFLLALLVVLVFSWTMQGFSNLAALPMVIPGVLMLLSFGWILAILAGFANVHFPDTQHLTEIVLQVAFYLTPIIYPPELIEKKGLIAMTTWNPFALFLSLIRKPILSGEIPSAADYAAAGLILAVSAAAALYVLHRLQRTLVFHL